MSVLTSLPTQFEQSGYRFNRLGAEDLKLVRFWLTEPHLDDWWTPAEDTLNLIESNAGADQNDVTRYLVSHTGREFAYIEVYDPAHDPQNWTDTPQGPGTFGLNQFIGDPSMIGFGHGTNFIRAFIVGIQNTQGLARLIVTPQPDNTPAIKCFSQVGFRKESDITTPNGDVSLMVMDL